MDYQEMEAALKSAREDRDEVLQQRNTARNLACALSDHCKMINKKWPDLPYPHTLIAQVDLARGLAGGYEYPVRDYVKEQAIIRQFHKSPQHVREANMDRT